MLEYYERRALEYDASSWDELDPGERTAVEQFVSGLPAGRWLDVGCGTGYLTRHLRGTVTGVDQSGTMLALARRRLPSAELVRCEIPPLPFEDDSYDFAFSSNVYSHLDTSGGRSEFLAEALRVACELIVFDQVWTPGLPAETWELRRLEDGTPFEVFKRYLTPEVLAAELGGEIVFESPGFVAVRARRA
jgi:SAM-dependent methyltransferase